LLAKTCDLARTRETTPLQWNNARWYNASIGRWMSEDWIHDDINTYRYVRNSSTNATDPTGLLGKIVVYIDTTNAPLDFNLANVTANVQKALNTVGVKIQFITTTMPRSSFAWLLGYRFDSESRLYHQGWTKYFGGCFLGTTYNGMVDLYHYATRRTLQYTHFIDFRQGKAVLGGASSTHKRYASTIYLAGTGEQVAGLQPDQGSNPDITYANQILHEVIWLGVIGGTDGILGSGNSPLAVADAKSTQLMSLTQQEMEWIRKLMEDGGSGVNDPPFSE
jgi:hypothetical protein